MFRRTTPIADASPLPQRLHAQSEPDSSGVQYPWWLVLPWRLMNALDWALCSPHYRDELNQVLGFPFKLGALAREIIRQRVPLTADDKRALRARVASLTAAPRFSLIVKPGGDDRCWQRTLATLCNQPYSAWELFVLGVPAAQKKALLATLPKPARAATRVLPGAGAASDLISEAIASATGDWIVLLNPGDELSVEALLCFAETAAARPQADIIYADEDRLCSGGRLGRSFHKPAWSPELLLAQDYFGQFTALRRAAVLEAGGVRPGLEAALEYDLALRITDEPREVVHVPRVLYHRGRLQDKTAAAATARAAASIRAIGDTLSRRGLAGTVKPSAVDGVFSLLLQPARPAPVSIVIPTRDRAGLLKQCVESLLQVTDYPAFEILIVDNGSRERETLQLFRKWEREPRVRIQAVPGEFNFSRLNNVAVRDCSSELVLLLNNDTQVIHSHWLKAMVGCAQLPGVGAVGAKLCFPSGTVQHAGLILRGEGASLKPAMSGHKFFSRRAPGYFGGLHAVRNVSAVTGACLLTHRELYDRVGGMDEDLAVAYNDVDFCLRVRRLGYRIVWTPLAELLHFESASRKPDASGNPRWEAEKARMHERWGAALRHDPYYSPHLSLDRTDFCLRDNPQETLATACRGRVVGGLVQREIELAHSDAREGAAMGDRRA